MKLNRASCPDGGIMQECYKDPTWGQVNLRTMRPHTTKPAHVHHRRSEKWVLVRGAGVWATVQQADGSAWTVPLPEWHPIDVPAGAGHTLENRGDDEAVILFWMDRVYDPGDPDKEPWKP